jgi:hypothetical protein
VNKLIWALFLKLLSMAVDRAEFELYASDVPKGKCMGRHDVPEVKDKYIVLHVGIKGWKDWTGYWQTA